MPDDSTAPAAPSGEPAAGMEPGVTPGVDDPGTGDEVDVDGETVLVDPGSAGDSADVAESGPTAVTPADPDAADTRH